jgi:alkyl sulfatase BDS1-like metallo-beta-lactamase superfamily hydrolase
MTTDLFLDFIAIRMDSREAGDMEFTINLVTPDNGEKFVVELSDATLTNIEGYQADDADLTITINRSDLETVMMGKKSFAAQIEDGTAKAEGDRTILAKLGATLAIFTPNFEMVPGTKGQAPRQDLNPYEVGPLEMQHE